MREHYICGGPSVDLYDLQHDDMSGTPLDGDVEFFVRQARRTGGPVLELGCGTGRVALPIARAGLEVVGIDLSPHMLKRARGKAKREGLPAHFRRGDMRRFRLGRRFRLVFIAFRTFQHLLTPKDQQACLERVRKHLAKGGRFIVNLFDPKLDLCVPGRKSTTGHRERMRHPVSGNRVDMHVENRENDPLTQTFRETWVWTERGRGGRVIRRTKDELRLRWTYRYEMRYLLERAGFRVVRCHGDFHGGAPRYGAEQIWIVV